MRFSVVALLAVSIGTCSAQPVELEVGFDRTGRVEWVTGGVVEITWKDLRDSRCAEGAV